MSTISQIRETAAQLSPSERAELAVFLLNGLDNTHYWVDDEEVNRRSEEMESGEVQGLSLEEFRAACGR
jgi:hypothetical protein